MIEIDESVSGPESGAQFFAGDNVSGALEEGHQYLKGLFLQPYFLSALAQFAGLKIYLECTKSHNAR